jgi:hypothetical protein
MTRTFDENYENCIFEIPIFFFFSQVVKYICEIRGQNRPARRTKPTTFELYG